jgi:hypothetical protein
MQRSSLAFLLTVPLLAGACQTSDGVQLRSTSLQLQAYPTGVISTAGVSFSR